MNVLSHLLERYRQFALRISIFNRVLIGNSIIIIFGAIGGTIITRQMTLFGNIWLILLFSFVGILITLFVNRMIIHTALLPLHELGDAIEQVHSGQLNIPDSLKNYKDPDIRRLVIAIDEMLNRMANYTSQLQAISERAINAQEEERVRIARSLHDDTAQSISMLIIHLERLGGLIPTDRPDIVRYISDAQSVATRLLENLRKIIWDLRPSILDDLGLNSAIRWYARTNLEKAGIKVDFQTAIEAMRLPPHLETMLFRIAQEAMSNILRHAEASRVSIRLWTADQHIWLEIEDDGRGFDLEKTTRGAVSHEQLGLLGIQERVSLVGGEVKIDSMEGSGTCLQVHVPLLDDGLLNAEDRVDLLEGRL
ncbi:MAG TPA: sensor histidine kinase [Anaerolineales bacterium]|nr:sensor histidine kinase [Anaerolineales bacterium]